MEYKDYYQTLGVPRNATEKEIKTAYRRLARKFHPDVNPGDKAAEEHFKEINEAYEVLSDVDKRKKYDEFGSSWQQYQQRGGEPGGFDWSQWAGSGFNQGQGQRTYTTYSNLDDLFGGGGGGGGFSDFFETLFGGGRRQAGAGFQGRMQSMPGQNLESSVEITLEEAMRGTTRILDTGQRRLEVKIPPGVDEGSRVRIAGEGGEGMGGGAKGDIYLNVTVKPHPLFTREGDNLRVKVSTDLYTAMLGGEIRVPTLTGNVMLKIPPETQNGRSFRLRGQGMPALKSPDKRGDLIVTVEVSLPQNLSSKEKDLFHDLAELRHQAA
jgi:curved DNA-binding protein